MQGDNFGFIDPTGRIVVPIEFDAVLLRFSRDRTIGERGYACLVLIDRSGRSVADLGLWPWPGLDDDEGFDDLARFVALDDFFRDGLIPWQRDGKWGYVDVDGHWIIAPQYEVAQLFYAGTASVQSGQRGFLIDTAGRQLEQTAVGWIGPRSGGLRPGRDGRPAGLRD